MLVYYVSLCWWDNTIDSLISSESEKRVVDIEDARKEAVNWSRNVEKNEVVCLYAWNEFEQEAIDFEEYYINEEKYTYEEIERKFE